MCSKLESFFTLIFAVLLAYKIIIIHEMGLVKICPCTKFEFYTYIHSKFTKGSPKFTNLASWPHYTPFGGIFYQWVGTRSIPVPNLKFIAASVPNIRITKRVPKFTNLACGPHAPHPLYGYFVIHRWDKLRSICVPNFMFLATPIPNLRKGVQNL